MKKNPKWNRTLVDDLTARTLFTEDNTDFDNKQC